MSILSVDNISPIGSGTSVTINSAATLVLTNANSTGVVTATSFVGSGINITGGNITLGDSSGSSDDRVKIGASNDLQLFHDSSATNNVISGHTGSLNLRNYDTNSTDIILSARNDILLQTAINESAIFCDANAGVHLYFNGTQKLVTDTSGVTVSGNVVCNSSSNQVYLQASDGSIELTRSSGGAYIDFKNSTSEDYDIRINEESGALRITSDFRLYDNKALELGTGSDLKIYHNASHSYIDNKTGNLYIRANTDSDVGGDIHIRAKSGENSLSCLDDGAVQLYHDNSLKLETISSGTRVTGNLEFNNSSTRIEEGNSNALRLRTDSGYVDIGPMNTTFCHIQTDRSLFYFNTRTQFNGHVEPYGNNVHNLGSSSNRWLDVFAQNLNITKASGNLSAYITASNGLGTIEVGGSTGAFIDLKHTVTDDFDVRLGANGSDGYLNVINNFTLTTNGKNSLYACLLYTSPSPRD